MATQTETATETKLNLTPPEPIPTVDVEKAIGLVPVDDEKKSELDAKVDGFIADLAAAGAVVCTAGNQLLSEAIHLGKPVLALPEDAVEQRLNAEAVRRMGVGTAASLHRLMPGVLRSFLEHADGYAEATHAHRRDGLSEAIDLLHGDIAALSRGTRNSPGPLAWLTGAY